MKVDLNTLEAKIAQNILIGGKVFSWDKFRGFILSPVAAYDYAKEAVIRALELGIVPEEDRRSSAVVFEREAKREEMRKARLEAEAEALRKEIAEIEAAEEPKAEAAEEPKAEAAEEPKVEAAEEPKADNKK